MNEHDAILFLRDKLGKQGQLVLPQVRNSTGFANKVRTADAIVAETWPSRGLSFTGIEYKKNLYDWRRELANPEKADEIGAYCKYWVVLAPDGVVPIGEVPETWGLWEIRGKQLMRTKAPPPTECKPPTAAFVCAMLRANSKYDPSLEAMYDMQRKAEKKAEEKAEERWSAKYKTLETRLKELEGNVRQFEQAAGVNIRYAYENLPTIGAAIGRYLRDPGFVNDELTRARDNLQRVLESIELAVPNQEKQE